MEKMLDKKQIWTIFLLEFQMSWKAVETINISNTFGPVIANVLTMQWFKKFCKEEKNFKDEEHSDLQ